ncbi:DNA polymerase III subunit beta [Azospirillum doebereinerae]|uniref:DNA polymerase III subunit beta n=1 Tax=Azospirillum doebereinerae TaxID=92933 RepID=UPI001EE5EF2D|nr:DNA polymerase III subunit beta [Azospirillum doebereinerae]MCG5238395.1 DNA polymerase III subunit beta [Azospirillum doebereinerae]
MKVTLDVTDLRALVDRVKGAVVSGEKALPILRCFQLTAKNNGLTAVAQDLDGLAIQAVVPATVIDPGSICVPGKLLGDFARKMADDADCTLQLDGPRMRVLCRRGRYELPVLPAEDFPAVDGLAAGAGVHSTRMPAPELLALIGGVAYAQSKDGARHYLNGVHLHVRKEMMEEGGRVLRGVATDGHRLARVERVSSDDLAGAPPIILPRESIAEILRAMEPIGSSLVEVLWSANLFRLVTGYVTVTTKLVDGTYPNYESVIPKRNGPVMDAEVSALRAAVERVATLARKGLVRFRFQRDELVLRGVDPNTGEALDVIPAIWAGPDLEVGYNARYLLDTLGRMVGDRVQLDPGDGLGPAVLRDPTAPTALYLVMPMGDKG